MSNLNIIRAWKDPDYRRGLTEEQRARCPPTRPAISNSASRASKRA
ncbi:MAG TPA: mersacidin/lichenicidin family type 2 lantibiotic [Gemmataceae bacterium]|jgi:mersacidin/lichenicidin family type 2 lantibiotic|nr:mersacidin/lichenicidin family type 2 lantibiotic [Gemmataceae bacterium]